MFGPSPNMFALQVLGLALTPNTHLFQAMIGHDVRPCLNKDVFSSMGSPDSSTETLTKAGILEHGLVIRPVLQLQCLAVGKGKPLGIC